MKTNRLPRIALLIAASFAATPFSISAQNKTENSFSGDPQIVLQYVPGKYYEQRAIDAVKRKNFRQAMEMYQKASYWGNKIAQYDAGMLYLNGADGIPADKVHALAWLGIAAQRHAPYVDQALGDAYGKATAEDRAAAGELWKQLMVDYADKVTLDRATTRFHGQYMRDKGQVIGSGDDVAVVYGNFGGGGGGEIASGPMLSRVQTIGTKPDSHVVNAATFLSSVKDQFSDYVQTQFGVVTVGEPETISEREQRAEAAQPAKH